MKKLTDILLTAGYIAMGLTLVLIYVGHATEAIFCLGIAFALAVATTIVFVKSLRGTSHEK